MAFVPEAFLIALREGLEAFLIVGILLGLVVKLERPDARRWVWGGFAAAVAASIILGVVIQTFLLEPFEQRGGGAWFELVAALAAVGVLTYMVFWMWKHTRQVMTGLRQRIATALTSGSLIAIAFLAFASVLREGLEVVLFYSALASRYAPIDLVWSGLVGSIVSIGLVAIILGTSMRFDLARFFAITGILLVFVAAGLLVHSVHAAMELGLLPTSETALWDTSAAISNDGAAGRVLHALFGYEAAPTLLQAVLYFGYLFGVGITYLWKIGTFHRNASQGKIVHKGAVAAAALLVLLASTATAIGAADPVPMVGHGHGGDEHGDGDVVEIGNWYHGDDRQGLHLDVDPSQLPPTIGVLLRVHGEPIHYNATTYESFRAFFEGLLVNAGMGSLLAADQGTILLDRGAPFAEDPRPMPDLYDAWTNPYDLLPAAVPVTDPADGLGLGGTYYASPAGPGLGEPDILEIFGLGTWKQWMKMEDTSPMHTSQSPYRATAEALLEDILGTQVIVETAFHIQPGLSKGEGEHAAVHRLVDAGADVIVDAYGSAIHSDIMDTCMMQPHVKAALQGAGFQGRYLKATNPGSDIRWSQAVVDHVASALDALPADARPALLLTHHGLSPESESPCAAGQADAYHAQADVLFDNVVTLLNATGLDARLVHTAQVYGQAAEGDDDPNNAVASSREAFQKARTAGATHVIDVPYELSGNGYDNLVVHRETWGFTHEEAPYFDDDGETRFVRNGVDVRITSSAFGYDLRGAAWANGVLGALAAAYGSADTDHH